MLLVGDDGRTRWNAAARELFGFDPGQAVPAFEPAAFRLREPNGAVLPPERWPTRLALAGQTVTGLKLVIDIRASGRVQNVVCDAVAMAVGQGPGGALLTLRPADPGGDVAPQAMLALLEAVPVPVLFVPDERRSPPLMNRAAAEVLGLPSTHVNLLASAHGGRRPGYDLLRDGRSVPQTETVLAQALRERRPTRDVEYEVVRADSSRRVVVGRAVPYRGGAIGVFVDITERKRMERSLSESEARFRSVLDSSLDAVYRRDMLSNRYDYLSPAISRISGFTPEEFAAMPMADVMARIHPADRPGVEQALAEAEHANQPRLIEYRFRHRDGTYRWFADSLTFHRGRDGRVRYRSGIIRDITERRRIEEELRASEDRFREAFAHAPIGMTLTDLEGRFQAVNPAYCDLVGYSEQELLSPEFNFWRLTHPDDRERNRQEYRRVIDGDSPAFFVEKRYLRKDGRTIWVCASATVRRDAEGRPTQVVGMVEDIDARKRAEQQLRRRTGELQRANAELEEFAYVASHDLKAPLRAVSHLAHAIDEEAADQLNPENRARLRLMVERVVRMDRLIEDLLTYARLGLRDGEEPPEPVLLEPLIAELVEELAPTTTLTIEVVPPLPALRAEPLHLRQIFQNLITNAVVHHDRAEGRVSVSGGECGEAWCVEVADDGPGIPAAMRESVFHMFTRARPVTGTEHTGIGLAIVRKLVRSYGGNIEVLANEPRGTRFRITWPQ